MASKLSDAVVRIEAETSQFNRQMRAAGLQVDRFAKGATTSLNILKTTIGALGIGFGAGFLVQGSKQLLDYADNIGKVADSIGVSTQNLQEFRVAAQLSGIGLDQMDQGLRNFAYVLGQARHGTGALVTILNKMDPAFLATLSGAKSTGDAFRLLINHTADLGNQMDKAAVFSAAFTQTVGVKMLNLIKGGAGAFDKMTQKARDMGLVLSDDLVRGAAKTNDNLAILADVVKVKLTRALVEMGPYIDHAVNGILAFTNAMDTLNANINRTEVQRLQDKLANLSDTLHTLEKYKEKGTSDGFLAHFFGSSTEDLDRRIRDTANKILALQKQIQALQGQPSSFTFSGGEADAQVQAYTAHLADLKAELKKAHDALFSWQTGDASGQVQAFKALQQQAEALTQSMRTPAEQAFDSIDKYNTLLNQGLISTTTWGRAVNKAMDDASASTDNLTNKVSQLNDGAKEIGYTFSSAFEDAVLQAKKLSDVMQGLLQDIARTILHQTVTAPLSNFVSGQIGNLFPGFATGTDYAPGGLALVGERGPELVNLPRGSQVIPNSRTMAGGVSVTIQNIDARGSTDPAATAAAVRRAVNQSVATIRDMKTRGKLPEFA